MATKFQLFIALFFFNCLGGNARAINNIGELIERLRDMECYRSDAKFDVLIPQSSEPITYVLSLNARSNDDDHRATCDYIIEWSTKHEDGEKRGFTAYHDGNHYRYRDNRLQEYHVAWDSIPFRSDNLALGVQNQAQFTEYLPSNIAEYLNAVNNDSTYRTTIDYAGETLITVSGEHVIAEVVCEEFEYTFDRETGLPVSINIESNPGSISEQTINIQYYNTSTDNCIAINDAFLMDSYPIAFEKHRESNFHIKNLRGIALPDITAQTLNGNHVSINELVDTPTLIVVLDTGNDYSRRIVNNVRLASESLPYENNIVWIFANNNSDEIKQFIGFEGSNEETLINSHSFIRKCGVTTMPTTILTDSNGIVVDVIIGYRKDLSSIVTQALTLALTNKNT